MTMTLLVKVQTNIFSCLALTHLTTLNVILNCIMHQWVYVCPIRKFRVPT